MPTEWFRTPDWSESARDEFERRLSRARDTSRPQYLRIKALALANADEVDGATALWNRVIDEFPNSLDATTALEHLGDTARGLGRREDAERYYRMVLERRPTRSGTTGMVEVSLAELLIDEKNEQRCNAALELL